MLTILVIRCVKSCVKDTAEDTLTLYLVAAFRQEAQPGPKQTLPALFTSQILEFPKKEHYRNMFLAFN